MHHDLAQGRQCWLEGFPNPHCQPFAGRIFQTGNVIEAAMIQLREDRLERRFHFGEIHDPTRIGRGLAAHMHFDAKRMAMHTRAFVPGRHTRQPVRSFELKDLENVHRSYDVAAIKGRPSLAARRAGCQGATALAAFTTVCLEAPSSAGSACALCNCIL